MGLPESTRKLFADVKIWTKSYAALPAIEWIHAKLFEKIAEISKGDAGAEAYKEFYILWMDTYQEIYGKHIQSMNLPGNGLNIFRERQYLYSMYKSWIACTWKNVEKAKEMSEQTLIQRLIKIL